MKSNEPTKPNESKSTKQTKGNQTKSANQLHLQTDKVTTKPNQPNQTKLKQSKAKQSKAKQNKTKHKTKPYHWKNSSKNNWVFWHWRVTEAAKGF